MAESPLVEPQLLLLVNCAECEGRGERPDHLVAGRVVECDGCDGSGRQTDLVGLSVALPMLQAASAQATAPPPSMLREHGA